MAILSILDGSRPKAPIFATTRGYTKELWEITISCWKEDPRERPTVDYVLVVLKNAAEEWKPKHGALVALSPQDDWSPTLTGESDSLTAPEHENRPITPEHEDGPVTAATAASASLTSLRPPVTETPAPTPTPSILTRLRRMWKSR